MARDREDEGGSFACFFGSSFDRRGPGFIVVRGLVELVDCSDVASGNTMKLDFGGVVGARGLDHRDLIVFLVFEFLILTSCGSTAGSEERGNGEEHTYCNLSGVIGSLKLID